MRNQLKIVYSALTIVAMLGLTSTVQGIPSFARQTGLDCNSCHAAVGFPVLNTFGQAFKAGGYTQASEDNLMGDGEALSLPKTLNMSVVAKIRMNYKSTTSLDATDPTKTASVGSNTADLPDEWAIWLAGRAGKHIGFATEFNGDGPLSFKMPIVYDIGPVKVGVVPYWTDAQGPGWGFETLSTGAVGNIKMFEGGSAQSARMYLDDAGVTGNNGEAAGLGVYVWHPMGFVYYSAYVVSPGQASADDPAFAHYIRVALTPSFGDIDAAVGMQFMTGLNGATVSPTDLDNALGNPAPVVWAKADFAARQKVNYLGFDAQLMGNFGIPMMFVATLGLFDTTTVQNNFAELYSLTAVKYSDVAAGAKGLAWTFLANATLVEDLLNFGIGVRMASYTEWVLDPADPAKLIAKPETSDPTKDQGTINDNQLVAELKINLARNLRLSATGYLSLNKVDVYKTDGTRAETSPSPNSQQNKLTVMLFGAF